LHRPAFLPVPAFALKIVFGGFASALLASQRVKPQVLMDSGYQFDFTELSAALDDLK
jgi:NAD dependent epimerase/dehydratase family enzyme